MLFKDHWHLIKNDQLALKKQDENLAVYHSKKEIDDFDYIDLNKSYPASELINKLRARSFGGRGFAFFETNGEKVFLKLNLSKNNKFS